MEEEEKQPKPNKRITRNKVKVEGSEAKAQEGQNKGGDEVVGSSEAVAAREVAVDPAPRPGIMWDRRR